MKFARKPLRAALRADWRSRTPGDQNKHSAFGHRNPGVIIRQNLPLNGILHRMANRLPPTPRPEKPKPKARRTRLSDEQISALRAALKFGELKKLAEQFGISTGYASLIRNGFTLVKGHQ